ncbi:MAG: exo-alpha-sialidase [Gemmatimonadota bacterium]
MSDPRDIRTGRPIPSEGYCDQPYVVRTDDGAWLCLLTTGAGQEGDARQHVVATRSRDQGRTWSPLVAIEPPGPPEASWVMPLKVPGGRVYAIYVYNGENRREVLSDHGPIRRVDTLGQYVFRYSDDGGRTWSSRRYEIPVRATQIDRDNPYGGRVRFFWGVGKPVLLEVAPGAEPRRPAAAIFGFAKVGRFGDGFMAASEGWFLRSDNIGSERDPERVRWELLPEGEVGLRAPSGPVADEPNPTFLSDGSLYCTFRTTDGHNGAAYSRDGGRTWDGPGYASYAPGGRLLRHPRAANFVRRFSNGKYVLWFHNHGGRDYRGRNPVWLCGGVEREGHIHWSQPEILLYDDDPATRMSYPDFIEEDGRYFVTETQKTVARVHEVDATLLEGLWRQGERVPVTRDSARLESPGGGVAPRPALPAPDDAGGFSVELWVRPGQTAPGEVLFTTRGADGRGVEMAAGPEGTVRLLLNDGTRECGWTSDAGALTGAGLRHVVATVDGGPRLVTFVVDGQLQDGGDRRQFGWGRFDRALGDVSGSRAGAEVAAPVALIRVHGRYLRTSEAVGNWGAGL